MISLTLACLLGGCLDQPMDFTGREPWEIIGDEFNRVNPKDEPVSSCYKRGVFYKQCPQVNYSEWGSL